MAIHRSVLKRARQNKKQRLLNNSNKSRVKTAIKKVHLAIKEEDVSMTKLALNKACSMLERAASKGIIHKNTAARKKSRLALAVNKSC